LFPSTALSTSIIFPFYACSLLGDVKSCVGILGSTVVLIQLSGSVLLWCSFSPVQVLPVCEVCTFQFQELWAFFLRKLQFFLHLVVIDCFENYSVVICGRDCYLNSEIIDADGMGQKEQQ
jgi:hypothetical protein